MNITDVFVWIDKTYFKSRCAYALKRILEVPEDEVRAYWGMYDPLKKNPALLEKLIGHKEHGVITAYRYASGSITSPQQLFLAVQESIRAALDQTPGSYKGENTLKDSVISWMENHISPEFQERVNANALTLPYTHLETRDSAILRVENKKSAFLYWIDALGVEYLSYISELVRKKGLSMHVDIAYAELPTITSINRGFFDKWPGPLKEKVSDLDDIKHHDKGGFIYDEKHEAPVHLAAELAVIERAIDRAATELAMHRCTSFVITSDHGASRLAVIRKQEEKYETDTKGEHSGRCCKVFPDADLPFAVQENGYYVLADYGRFKKSRAANVEVHGGASLEEAIVPVITLTLRKQSAMVVQLADPENIRADRKKGTTFVLYISEVENANNVSVIIAGDRYAAQPQDATHFVISMPSQKRSKKNVLAEVYDGNSKQYFISKKFPMRPTFEDDAEIVDAMTEYEAKLRELDVLKKKRSVMQ